MSSRFLSLGFAVLLGATPLSASEITEGQFFVPPANSFVAPTPSEAMKHCVNDLIDRNVFGELSSFARSPELPAWIKDTAHREVAYLYENASSADAFRYAVILGAENQVAIVRAGGLQDLYEIYELQRAEPGATDNPDDTQRLREDH